jgi:hypothetical protein
MPTSRSPDPENKNSTQEKTINSSEPRTGTPKIKCPKAITSAASKMPRMTYGRILPNTSSIWRMGVTINCSIVPRSRSRTTAEAVSMAVMAYRIMAMTPGIIK